MRPADVMRRWGLGICAACFFAGWALGFFAKNDLLKFSLANEGRANAATHACEETRQEESALCREEVRRLVQVSR